jgi:hypothetical protein
MVPVAYLLLVDGNPLEDVAVLAGPGAHLAAVMKGGAFASNRIA